MTDPELAAAVVQQIRVMAMEEFDKLPLPLRNFINEFGMAWYQAWVNTPMPKMPLSTFGKAIKEQWRKKHETR